MVPNPLLNSAIDRQLKYLSCSSMEKNLASLSPHTAISLALDNILMCESEQVGMGFDTFNDEFYNYKVSTCYLMLLLNIFVFFILGVYLD